MNAITNKSWPSSAQPPALNNASPSATLDVRRPDEFNFVLDRTPLNSRPRNCDAQRPNGKPHATTASFPGSSPAMSMAAPTRSHASQLQPPPHPQIGFHRRARTVAHVKRLRHSSREARIPEDPATVPQRIPAAAAPEPAIARCAYKIRIAHRKTTIPARAVPSHPCTR
jgi:hypothetical protein